MRRILCLHLPHWPIQRLYVADRGLDARRPLILHARDSRRGQLVTACNRVAGKLRVRPAMPLAEATALLGRNAECYVLPADNAADRAALARLTEHCERFSPIVGWGTTDEMPTDPDRLLFDVTGTASLFGGEESLVREVSSDLTCLGYTAGIAIADTVGAAWARAAFQEPLPVAALRLPAETAGQLAQLGITAIEQLLKLPRASLPGRFGQQLVQRLDQFLGTAAETIVPHRPPPEFIADAQLEYPAEHLELVEQIVGELVKGIAEALAQRREGALRLVCRLDSTQVRPVLLQVGLFRPSADPRHLGGLLRMQLEQVTLPGPVSRVTLEASLTAPLENRQGELFAGNQQEAARQGELLIDRLSSRLGPDAVLRVELTADPLPERAVRCVPLVRAAKKRQPRQTAISSAAHRPVLLRTAPLALEMMAIAPDGPPASFHLHGQQCRVEHWWGPERIESGWWRGPSARRDYYRVEISDGRRYWLFQRLTDGAWFLHGEFS